MGARAYKQVSLSSHDFAKQCPCPEGLPDGSHGTSRCRRKRQCDWAKEDDAKAEASRLRDEILQDWRELSRIQRLTKVDRLVQLCLCKPCKGRKFEVRDKLLAQMYEEEGDDDQAVPDGVDAAASRTDQTNLMPVIAVHPSHGPHGQQRLTINPEQQQRQASVQDQLLSPSSSSSITGVEQPARAKTISSSEVSTTDDQANPAPSSSRHVTRTQPAGRVQPSVAPSRPSVAPAPTSMPHAHCSVRTANSLMDDIAQLQADNAELRRRLEVAEHQTGVWRKRFQICARRLRSYREHGGRTRRCHCHGPCMAKVSGWV